MSNETEKLYIVATVKGSSVMWVQPNAEAVGDRDGLCRHADAAAIIAKRDARIAELEAPMLAWSDLDYTKHTRRSLMCYIGQQNFRITAQEKQLAALKAELSACVIGGTGISSSMRGALAEAGQQPSAGVVLPERKVLSDLMMASYHEAKGHNACLDEVSRLNPCRAQDVPGWADAVEACAKLCEERAAYYESGDDDAPGSRRGNACRNCADVIRYNLAAPPAKKESGHYSDQDWINAGCPRNEEPE